MGNTKINFRTAEGIARYPRLTNADELDDKFKTQLIMSPEAAKPLMAMCLEAGEEATAHGEVLTKYRQNEKQDFGTDVSLIVSSFEYPCPISPETVELLILLGLG